MKKVLLIIGIIVIVVGILALLRGGLAGYIGRHTLDASNSFYDRNRRIMKIYLAMGMIISVLGVLCVVGSRLKG